MVVFKEIKSNLKTDIILKDKNDPDKKKTICDGGHVFVTAKPIANYNTSLSTKYPFNINMVVINDTEFPSNNILGVILTLTDKTNTSNKTIDGVVWMTPDEYDETVADPIEFYKRYLLSMDDITFTVDNIDNQI